MLLGPNSVPRLGFRMWGKTESIFLFALICLTWGVGLFSSGIYKLIDFLKDDYLPVFAMFSWVIAFLYLFIMVRLSVIYPSIAVGDGANIKRVYKLTEGHGFKLAILVGIIPIVFNKISDWLYDADISLSLYIIGFYASVLLIVYEVILLSLAYKYLSGNRGAGSDQHNSGPT